MTVNQNKSIIPPENLGLIADGNGRWAQNNNMPRNEGHVKGLINMIKLADYAFAAGVKNVVCYALSADNLKRAENEGEKILSLVDKYSEQFVDVFSKRKAAVRFVGNLDLLPEKIKNTLAEEEKALALNAEDKTIYIAIAYGGRREIVSAVNKAIEIGRPVDENIFTSFLSMPENLDLIIRTGGRKRLSDFFLYQASYAELYFSDKLFPDFTMHDMDDAFRWYSEQPRTFGLIK